MLVFLACDQRRLDDLRQGMADAQAWKSISDEAEELGLAVQQAAQARSKQRDADSTLQRRMADSYTWALVPVQPDATGPITLEPQRVEGAGDLAARTSRRLVDKGLLSLVYAPSLLRTLVLEGPLSSLWARGHVSVNDLWESLARYPYLPRFRDREVLQRAVQTGPNGLAWQTEGFALADGYDEAARRYLGLVVGPTGAGAAVSGTTLLVRPEVAVPQAEADGPATVPSGVGSPGTTGGAPTPTTNTAMGETLLPDVHHPRRFHGSVVLRSDRLSLEFGRVVQEVIQRLSDANGSVEVTVEISATSQNGFDETIIRTITENARTLHFRVQGFEAE